MLSTKTKIRDCELWHNEKGERHREDGPAVIWANGTKEWYLNGKLHREDGPALTYSNGDQYWYKNGEKINPPKPKEETPVPIKTNPVVDGNGTQRWYNDKGQLHREDGPAVVYSAGGTEWYKDGQFHREDGPALSYSSGARFWYMRGKRHREDGPAIVYSNGEETWYNNGVRIDSPKEETPVPATTTNPEVNSQGTQFWRKDSNLHRDDGPAIVYTNGQQEWYQNGKRHREDGPAIIYADGTESWYLNGVLKTTGTTPVKTNLDTDLCGNKYSCWKNDKNQLHREDGPAIIWNDGSEAWFKNGLHHREDGPAIIRANGSQEWYKDGVKIDPPKLKEELQVPTTNLTIDSVGTQRWKNGKGQYHREDGPAIIWVDGTKIWCKDGKWHREDGPAVIRPNGEQEWWQNDSKIEPPNGNRIDPVVDADGTQCWKNDKGQLHREDGPAIIGCRGTQHWYLNGQRHRDYGPAIIHADGTEEWWKNGKCHRDNGPAVVYADGKGIWYKNGEKIDPPTPKEETPVPTAKTNPVIDKHRNKCWHNDKGQIHREDGPAYISADDTQAWYLNDKLHREDGPAVVYKNGAKEWWKNGLRHREEGPAVVWADGAQAWYKNGVKIKFEQIYNKPESGYNGAEENKSSHDVLDGRDQELKERKESSMTSRKFTWVAMSLALVASIADNLGAVKSLSRVPAMVGMQLDNNNGDENLANYVTARVRLEAAQNKYNAAEGKLKGVELFDAVDELRAAQKDFKVAETKFNREFVRHTNAAKLDPLAIRTVLAFVNKAKLPEIQDNEANHQPVTEPLTPPTR